MRLYGEIIDRIGARTMLYLTCITISSVDLAQYGVSLTKDMVSVECGTIGKRSRQRGVFLLLWILSVGISLSPHVSFILVLI